MCTSKASYWCRLGTVFLLVMVGERRLLGAGDRTYPPLLPGGAEVASDTSPEMLTPPASAKLRSGVEIAQIPPAVDFLFYSGQDHKGNPWSNWGDGVAVGDKYYSAIGDHLSPRGTAQIYEFDRKTRKLRLLFDARKYLEATPGALPAGMDYTPGKIHCRLEIGSDGMLYFATHRGSGKTTTDKYGFLGDWIFRLDPASAKAEIVAAQPIPKHCIPAGFLDRERMIFYGGTADGADAPDKGVWFFAYDVKNRKMIFKAAGGFDRCAIFSSSSGRLYWAVPSANSQPKSVGYEGRMYDPASNTVKTADVPHVRSATRETPQGWVYGTSGTRGDLWAFNVKTEELKQLGSGAVGKSEYTTSIDADAAGRYLYYVPGAHGGGAQDGTPVVQYDTKSGKKKIIMFAADFYAKKYGYVPDGTFSTALSPDDATLYVTWNEKGWQACAMMAIHIPDSERKP